MAHVGSYMEFNVYKMLLKSKLGVFLSNKQFSKLHFIAWTQQTEHMKREQLITEKVNMINNQHSYHVKSQYELIYNRRN